MNTHPRIARAIAYIEEHLDERLSLVELAGKAGLSIWRFCAVFRQHTGMSPRRYVWHRRLAKVQSLLDGGEPQASAARMAGFYDQSHLCRHFRNSCGMTPGEYISRTRAAAGTTHFNHRLEVA